MNNNLKGNGNPRIADSTIHRLSKYYRTLTFLEKSGTRTVSSDMLAVHNSITAAQVRKDLSFFGAFGRRGLGYSVENLKENLSKIIGLNRSWRVAIAGVGNIGRAMIAYDQFRLQGFEIVMAFDTDPAKIGKSIHGIIVRDERNLGKDLKSEEIDIAIIAVPGSTAQAIVDKFVDNGIKAFLNFAPVNLQVPSGIFLRNENMAIEIEALTFALTNPQMVKDY